MSDYASSLPVRTETNGDVAVKLVDATVVSQGLNIDASGRITAKAQDGSGNALTSQASGAQQALDVGINVAGVQVDPRAIRALTSSDVVSANIRDNTGTAFSAANPLPVYMADNAPGDEINDYNTASAIVAGASSNHDYTVTALKTFTLTQIEASASGKMKIEVQVETGVSSGTFNTRFVQFNSTATPNMSILLSKPISVAAGVRVRIVRTNVDKAAMDVYSTISGSEV